ncbi:hypothetical protein ACTWPB_22430 [Nocardia sp. IBHARD005]
MIRTVRAFAVVGAVALAAVVCGSDEAPAARAVFTEAGFGNP